MNSKLSLLLIILYNTNPENIDYCIALQILHSLNQLDKLTVSSLKEKCSTSTKTIQKFCNSLGFDSFIDFKYSLITSLNIRSEQNMHRIQNTSETDILKNIQFLSNNYFNETEFKNSINQLVDTIHKASTLYIIGAAFPNALSINFQEDMNIMGKLTYCYQVNNNPQFPLFSENDLIIIISISGNFYKYAKEHFKNLYKKNKNHIFILSGYSPFRDSNIANNFIQMYIDEDDEKGNLIIMETLRYIKYQYFYKYIKEK